MTAPRLAPTMRLSVADVRADVGPEIVKWVIPLDVPAIFQWTPDSLAVDDGLNIIVPVGGGAAGAWIRMRENRRGADLTNADVHIAIAGNRLRNLPAATLTGPHTVTVDMAGALPGDEIEIVRFDVSAFTYAVINGGPLAGTLVTLPISARSKCVVRMNAAGTNWELGSSGLML